MPRPLYASAPAGDTRHVYVVQQDGVVLIIEDGVLRPEPFIDLSDRVFFIDCCEEDVGLLSIAFHPDYANNGRFFVNYNDFTGDTVISRFETVDIPGLRVGNADSEIEILTISQLDPYHNGGQLQFGPDGYLYVGMGDGNGDIGGDPAGTAQNDQNLLGKMLRIDVDIETPPFYAAPPDNPPSAGGVFALIWAKGLRNPWRFSFDRGTGDLYIADVGQDEVEEIDFQSASSTARRNYGWNFYEGSSCFAPTACPSTSQFAQPIYEYGHSGPGLVGFSVTGGYVYRGCAMPDLHGAYFYADFATGFVRSFVYNGSVLSGDVDRTAALAPGGGRSIDNPTSFGEDARGELYILDYDGEVYKIVPGS